MAAIAPAITLDRLTKRFGPVTAVDSLSFTAMPGRVLGFLGPNGSGKTTTLRMLLGLAKPNSGAALIGGRTYTSYEKPMDVIGSSLEANSFNAGRTGRNHLRVIAAAADISEYRVDAVLDLVGLSGDGKRRVKEYSLGMRQRLGLAAAMLSDPGVLVLDEPANGLDPEGIRWMRELLRHLADEGRTVLVSSHMLSEVGQTADDIVIINHGVSVFAGELVELEQLAGKTVVVDSPTQQALADAVNIAGFATRDFGGAIGVDGATALEVGHIAFAAGIELSHLAEQRASLEEVFVGIIRQSSQGRGEGGFDEQPDAEAVGEHAEIESGAEADATSDGGLSASIEPSAVESTQEPREGAQHARRRNGTERGAE